jgi:large-conductance mechanosensitive channel
MDDSVKTSTPDRSGPGNWVGRIIVAVILGEAIWNLIVSVMNNLVVPWLGDVMGQSSGLPTSFTQRPYNYPDLFVAVVEFCIAGLVAAILNYFLQRRTTAKVRVKSLASSAPVGPVRVVPAPPSVAQTPVVQTPISQALISQSPIAQAPIAQAPITQVPSTQAYPPIAPPESKPVLDVPPPLSSGVVATTAKPAASSVPSAPNSLAESPQAMSKPQVAVTPAPARAPKVEPAKPKKPKAVYYNIVGEPVSSDDD